MAPMMHNPLEDFLICQAIYQREQETHELSFEWVSESLKNNEISKLDKAVNTDRFDPEALRNAYFRLLKEEVRNEAVSRDGSPTKGSNPKKRTLSSPLLETVEDTLQYNHLLPKLTSRLYSQYRQDALKLISEEERRYEELHSAVEKLKLENIDTKASRPLSSGVPPISALLRATEDATQWQTSSNTSVITSNGVPRPTELHVAGEASRNLHSEIYRPLAGQSYDDSRAGPYLPPPSHSSTTYPVAPTGSERRTSQTNAPIPSPRPDRSSASPVILPPPKGMARSAASPPQHHDPPIEQYRHSPTIPSPQNTQYSHPVARQHSHSRPVSQQYPPYFDPQNYPMAFPLYGQSHVPIFHPHAGGMQQFSPPSHGPPYTPQAYGSPIPPQHAVYYASQGHYQPHGQPIYGNSAQRQPESRTPTVKKSIVQQPPQATPSVASASSTKWKAVDGTRSRKSPQSPSRPQSRDISPISTRESSVEPKDAKNHPKREKKAQIAAKHTPGQQDQRESHIKSQERNTRRRRDQRAASTGSSRRSVSVEKEDDIKPTRTQRSIKPEDDSTSVASVPADDSARRATRRRQSSVRGADVEGGRMTMKRKREGETVANSPQRRPVRHSIPSTPSAHRPHRRAGQILATRNLPRIAHTLLTSITSHRLASLFAKPLTEREAPGYKDLIFRPQDLKSVRTALTAGSRALIAVIEEMGDEAGSGQHVWVPENEDLLPPKGIVNAAQLEKELMRMFANAIMFNPDVASNRGIGPAFRTRQQRKSRALSKVRKLNPDTLSSEYLARIFVDSSSNGANDMETSDIDSDADSDAKEGEGIGIMDDGTRFELGVASAIEGAVSTDAREVARDVLQEIRSWREVESRGDEDEEGGDESGSGSEEGEEQGTPTPTQGAASSGEEHDEDENEGEDEEEEETSAPPELGRRSKRRRK